MICHDKKKNGNSVKFTFPYPIKHIKVGFFPPNFSKVEKRNFKLPSCQSPKNYNFDFMEKNKESMLESDKYFMHFQLSISFFFFFF